jgi:hypothetical protein
MHLSILGIKWNVKAFVNAEAVRNNVVITIMCKHNHSEQKRHTELSDLAGSACRESSLCIWK